MNVELNNLKDKVEVIQGDVKKFAEKISRRFPARPPQRASKQIKKDFPNIPSKFDVIVMPRPRLKETFLKEAFLLSKKGTSIYYYDFCKISEKEKIVDKIKNEAKKSGKKIKITKTKIAGEIAPYKIRMRVDLLVL